MINYHLIYNLRQHAQNFRDAIYAAKDADERYIFFYKFPTGECGHTSDLLAKYLYDKGYSDIIYKTGEYRWDGCDWDQDPTRAPQQHTWLMVDGLVVDITGDQFRGAPSPITNTTEVYVGPETSYYDLFDVRPNGVVEITDHYLVSVIKGNLAQWYQVIMKYISE